MKKNNQSIIKILKLIASNSDVAKKLSKLFSESLNTKIKVILKETGISTIEENKGIYLYHRDEKNLVIIQWDLELVKLLLKEINEDNQGVSEINKKIFIYKFGFPVFEIFKDSFQKYINIKELNLNILNKDVENFEIDAEFSYLNYQLNINNNEFYIKIFIPIKLTNEIFSNITLSDIFSKKGDGKKYDFYKIPLKAEIIFGKKTISISDYLKIKPNDLITLNKEDQTTVWIYFNNGKKIKGILGTSQGRLAIKITDI